jgi:hypothetical protein
VWLPPGGTVMAGVNIHAPLARWLIDTLKMWWDGFD